MKSKME